MTSLSFCTGLAGGLMNGGSQPAATTTMFTMTSLCLCTGLAGGLMNGAAPAPLLQCNVHNDLTFFLYRPGWRPDERCRPCCRLPEGGHHLIRCLLRLHLITSPAFCPGTVQQVPYQVSGAGGGSRMWNSLIFILTWRKTAFEIMIYLLDGSKTRIFWLRILGLFGIWDPVRINDGIWHLI